MIISNHQIHTESKCQALLATAIVMAWMMVFNNAGFAQVGKEVIVAKGATTMANGVNALAAEFQQQNPNVSIVVSAGGANKGIREFLEGNANLLLATRELNSEEMAKAAARGIEPSRRAVGLSCLAILVNTRNPVNELTLEQIKLIFSGKIRNWKEVGGNDERVQVYLPDPQFHAAHDSFRKLALEGLTYTTDARIKPDYIRILKDISHDKSAIAFATVPGRGDKTRKELGVKIDRESPATMPSNDPEACRAYPVSHSMYFYWNAKTQGEGLKRFVDFCEQQGVRPQ